MVRSNLTEAANYDSFPIPSITNYNAEIQPRNSLLFEIFLLMTIFHIVSDGTLMKARLNLR